VRKASLLVALFACSPGPTGNGNEIPDGAHASFALAGKHPDAIGFLDAPWPSDLLIRSDGTLQVIDFPNPGESVTIEDFKDTFSNSLKAWGTQSGAFFFFDRALDASSVSAGPASLGASSSVWIMDVESRERFPVDAKFFPEHPWLPANTLAVLPHAGSPLRSARKYVFALTRAVKGADGKEIQPGEDFAKVRDAAAALGDPALEKARAIFTPAFDALAAAGLVRADVRAATVLTTQDAVGEMQKVREALVAAGPPALADVRPIQQRPDFCGFQYEATYTAPIFMKGNPPYRSSGGEFVLDAEGRPEVQHTEKVWIGIAFPGTPPPSAEGFPVIVYGHGSGGDRWAYLGEMECDFIRADFAIVALDFPLHGKRPGAVSSSEELAIITFTNPVAGRNFNRQAASDLMQLVRLLKDPQVSFPQPIKLDRRRLVYLSQSMGGFIAPVALALEPGVVAAAMNGAGGGQFLYYMPRNAYTKVNDVPLLYDLLGLLPETVDRYHPFLHLGQVFTDAADPVSFARHLAREPLAGNAPKHLFFLEGDQDQYVANASTEALVAAAGVDVVQGPNTWLPPALEVLGRAPIAAPAKLNLDGRATAALYQYHHDHFALDEDPKARAQIIHFFRGALAGDSPEVKAY
jgi:pimeloyl-ACP methyl ester carboxylesterase